MQLLPHCGSRETLIQTAPAQVNEIRQLEQRSNTILLIPTEECIPASLLRRSRPVTDGPYAETKEFAAG